MHMGDTYDETGEGYTHGWYKYGKRHRREEAHTRDGHTREKYTGKAQGGTYAALSGGETYTAVSEGKT